MTLSFTETSNNLKPVTKWVGGKRQLLPKLKEYLPANFNTYFEPFVGGGALLFDLHPNRAVINDMNSDLINAYEVIRDHPDELLELLKLHQEKNSKEYYLELRNLDRTAKYASLDKVTRAARLLYMLRVDFNGMYRVNSKGQFNVPYGRYKNPKIVNEANIYAVSEYFRTNNIQITNSDFAKIVATAKKDDLVYFDPPYIPVTETASFTAYTKDGFTLADQERLRDTFFELAQRGVKVMLSNSDTDIIHELYAQAHIHQVQAKRAINSVASKRGQVGEVIITSY